MSPEAVLARATAARGDIFPEWKILAHAEKLVRDGIIWTHLAGDASQRLKVIRRLPKA